MSQGTPPNPTEPHRSSMGQASLYAEILPSAPIHEPMQPIVRVEVAIKFEARTQANAVIPQHGVARRSSRIAHRR